MEKGSEIAHKRREVLMRVVVYSKGKLFQHYKKLIDWSQVVVIADKNADDSEMIEGKKVLHPCELQRLQYDYIAIFSDNYFYDVRKELIGEYFIAPDKIISWRFFLKKEYEPDVFFSINRFIRAFKIKSMLDIGMCIIPKCIFSKTEIESDLEFTVDGVGIPAFLFYGQIYDRVYKNLDDVGGLYELIYINDDNNLDINTLRKICRHRLKYLLLRVPYINYSKEKIENLYLILQQMGSVKKFYLLDSVYLFLTDNTENNSEIDVKIYVVTHKRYNIQNNELYYPICVGNKYLNNLYLSEHVGDNIGYLNEKINECTALYWIWKNTASEYVGINHYRRYFYNNEIISENNYLNKESICSIFQKYDIVLPHLLLLENSSVEEQIIRTISKDAYINGYKIIKEAIRKHQADYLDAFETVMQGNKLFVCNMFITRRKIFDQYCEWLFSFLIEAAENMDITSYDTYSKRVIGFFAERMMTVWLLNHNFRIKELTFDVIK